MSYRWELRESGPADAAQTVLLLPGGLSRASSYAEVMAQPLLAGTRLIAATLPGHDEPMFFRAICRLGDVLGGLPTAALLKMMGPAAQKSRLPADRSAELVADLRSNHPHVMRKIFSAYLAYPHEQRHPAERLCLTEVPVWVVHTEHGDGGLTDHERHTPATAPTICPAPSCPAWSAPVKTTSRRRRTIRSSH